MFSSPPEKGLYCYGIYQPLFEEMENLVILDDLMECVTSSSNMENLFVKGVHHLHLSVLYINQNLYCKGKHSCTINLNTHIYVLMEKPKDVLQIQCLARQAFLGKCSFLMEAYKDTTSQP